ncbi:MAG: hypothetical protein H0T61_00280 [Actinobacteria bacterium]|nr:hypothetical protein [Actinomycetota bacterium]
MLGLPVGFEEEAAERADEDDALKRECKLAEGDPAAGGGAGDPDRRQPREQQPDGSRERVRQVDDAPPRAPHRLHGVQAAREIAILEPPQEPEDPHLLGGAVRGEEVAVVVASPARGAE